MAQLYGQSKLHCACMAMELVDIRVEDLLRCRTHDGFPTDRIFIRIAADRRCSALPSPLLSGQHRDILVVEDGTDLEKEKVKSKFCPGRQRQNGKGKPLSLATSDTAPLVPFPTTSARAAAATRRLSDCK